MTPILAFLTIALIILPQWLLMLFRPHNKWTQELVDSDIIPFVLLILYVVCTARNSGNLEINTVTDIFRVFQTDNIVLGAWAFIGFLSLLISGWVFNQTRYLTIKISWVMPSLFATFTVVAISILTISHL